MSSKIGRPLKGKALKIAKSCRVEEHRLEYLIKEFGGFQKAVDHLMNCYFENDWQSIAKKDNSESEEKV